MELLIVFCCLVVWTGNFAESKEITPLTILELSFDPALNESGSMPEKAELLSLRLSSHSDPECYCRQRCLSILECRGYGFSERSQTCQLTRLLPTSRRLQPSKDIWKWYARVGLRQLNEPCSSHESCAFMVPGAGCQNNTCKCWHHLVPTAEGQCRKEGQFRSVGTGRLHGSALRETAAASADECRRLGAADPNCMAFDFSSAEQRCTFYHRGITSDASSGRDTESFVWVFPEADGDPPEDFQSVNGVYLGLRESGTPHGGAFACFPAILYPTVTAAALVTVYSSPLLSFAPKYVVVGIDDILYEGQYRTSDWASVPADKLPWGDGERTKAGSEDCMLGANGTVHDITCKAPVNLPALCQFEGANLALGRPAWFSSPFPGRHAYHAENGVDGNLTTLAHSGVNSSPTWTVDLGGPVQVTGVLLASRSDCCQYRNVNTEYRVSFSRGAWNATSSARCLLVTPLSVPQQYTRLFRCAVPVTGRYLQMKRIGNPYADFMEVAVFGNRLHDG